MNKERKNKDVLGTVLAVGGFVMGIWGLVDYSNFNKDIESQLNEQFPQVRNVCHV